MIESNDQEETKDVVSKPQSVTEMKRARTELQSNSSSADEALSKQLLQYQSLQKDMWKECEGEIKQSKRKILLYEEIRPKFIAKLTSIEKQVVEFKDMLQLYSTDGDQKILSVPMEKYSKSAMTDVKFLEDLLSKEALNLQAQLERAQTSLENYKDYIDQKKEREKNDWLNYNAEKLKQHVKQSQKKVECPGTIRRT